MTHDLCPPPEMLAAYLDGTLDVAQRVAIKDHISRCEECYFVVKEAALVHAEPSGSVETPAAARGLLGLRRPFDRLLPLAAALLVGVGALALWRQARHVDPYAEAIKPLVNAVGERRFIEPRLAGGFKYGPTVGSRRAAATGTSSESWAMMAAATELRQGPEPTSPAERGSRAAAALLLGDADLAVAEYSRLVAEDRENGRWSSDLAAALLVRVASTKGAETDASEALRLTERALALDPTLDEARFNRCLALKALGRADEAARGFRELAERGGPWSAAARDELREPGGRGDERP